MTHSHVAGWSGTWCASSTAWYPGGGVCTRPAQEIWRRYRADLDVRSGPCSAPRRLPVDRVAISAVQAGVGRVEASLDVKDVTAGMRSRPCQVAGVVIMELLNGHVRSLRDGTGWPLGAIVADSCQRHRLVAREADLADPSIRYDPKRIPGRFATGSDAVLARTKSQHLLYRGQFRPTQNDATSPFEVAAARVMPQSRLSSGQGAVEVNWIHHVPDIRILHRARHRPTLWPGADCGTSFRPDGLGRVQPARAARRGQNLSSGRYGIGGRQVRPVIDCLF